MALNNSHGGEYTQTENGSILQRLSALSGTVCDRLRSIKALPGSKTALSTLRFYYRKGDAEGGKLRGDILHSSKPTIA